MQPDIPLKWYRQDGEGTPLVFLHGLFETSAIWDPLIDGLPELSAPMVALPLPGHSSLDTVQGVREALAGDSFIDSYADTLRGLFGDCPVRLVGHSTGGFISLLLARRHPDLVRDMCLIGALVSGDLDGTRRLSIGISSLPILGPLTFGWMCRYWLTDPHRFRRGMEAVFAPAATDSLLPYRMRGELAAVPPETLRLMALWLARRSIRETLAEIDHPALCVIGTQDPVVPPAHQLGLIKGLPNGHALLMNTGHLPFLEDPNRFRRIFLNWLASAPEPLSDPARPAASAPAIRASRARAPRWALPAIQGTSSP
ncbi:alpha/beta fold hydrolase [Aestuariibius insulae]|uniref:alpha/beta fold hydrolase n=1 Tax=Aestuariibius insulae TaxID=2058287 RepID=UPI00345EDEBA